MDLKHITTLGRILFAIPFAIFGINHILMVDWYLGTFSSFIPLGPFTIIFTGIVLIATSISIITKYYVRFMAYVLAVLLAIFILSIHLPHLFDDTSEKAIVMITLLKDISLLGGSLMIAGIWKSDEKKLKKTLRKSNKKS
jgi:uncharacterized membrane protein YphA (DoxX/SURF4 family)